MTVTSRTSLGRFLSLCVRFGLKKGSKTTSLQQLLQLTYAPPRRRICFVTSLTMSKSVYRHFGSMASSSARARAAGIWAGNGALEKGVRSACFLDELCWQVLGTAARCFVLLWLLVFALESNFRQFVAGLELILLDSCISI